MTIKKVFLSTLLLSFLTSCVPEVSDEDPNLSYVNNNLPLRWNSSSLPLRVKVQSSFVLPDKSDDQGFYPEYDIFEEMQKEWNDADPNRTFFELGHGTQAIKAISTNLDSYYDGEVGIYLSDSWFDEIGTGVLAITSYFAEHRGTYLRMVHGDIIVNNKHYYFTFDKTDPSSLYYDLPSVLLHELGHLIGLKHTNSSSVDSIMYPQLGGGEKKRSLSFYDSQSVTNLYGNSLALSAAASTAEYKGPKFIHGYIELRTDGSCNHYQDDKLVDTHKVKLNRHHK